MTPLDDLYWEEKLRGNELKPSLWNKTKAVLNNRGPIGIISSFFEMMKYQHFKIPHTFEYMGKTYSEFYHWYNTTWRGSREMEIPIGYEFIKDKKEVLEIGNVLKHYYPELSHDVLDKYEKAKGVINKDLADYSPDKKYDYIISISTLEHIEGRDNLIASFDNIKYNLLNKGGKCLFTIPLGFNKDLDILIEEGDLINYNYIIMQKIDGEWQQVSDRYLPDFKYEDGFILIGEINN